MARVLMVDDQEIGLKILGELIGAYGHEFQTATNSMEAMEKTRTFQPDIILLDIMMPGMDGYEVCRRLKADPQTQAIPVVMITGLDEFEIMKSHTTIGARMGHAPSLQPGDPPGVQRARAGFRGDL